MLCVANMARAPSSAELDLSGYKGRVPVELLGRSPPFPAHRRFTLLHHIGRLRVLLVLAGGGGGSDDWYGPYVTPLPRVSYAWYSTGGWSSIIDANNGEVLSWQTILPGSFLPNQRGSPVKGKGSCRYRWPTRPNTGQPVPTSPVACIDCALEGGAVQKYLLPLSIAWGNKDI